MLRAVSVLQARGRARKAARHRPAASVILAAAGVHLGLGVALRRELPMPGDRAVAALMSRLRTDRGVETVKELTQLTGTLPYVGLLVGVSAGYAVLRGRPDQAVVLVAGLLSLVAAVPRAKAAWDRPRPEDMLAEAPEMSYPSAHSAYATAWTACALVTGRRELVATGSAVTAAVGLSRLYLRVHFLSDVLGGFALGAAAFGALSRRA